MKEVQHQLHMVNQLVVDYQAKVDRTKELEEQNARLKKLLLDVVMERKNMRTGTLFAMGRARQFEVEFESIQKEWNRNKRMQNMMLTSWPEDEQMYPSRWDENKEWTLASRSLDWQQVTDEDYHWNVEQEHEYPYQMAGQKLWPNPHPMVSNGSVCAICQSAIGLEGCFQVGSYGTQFHPQCFIGNMIRGPNVLIIDHPSILICPIWPKKLHAKNLGVKASGLRLRS